MELRRKECITEKKNSRRMNIIARTELNNKNLVNAINTKVIPVAAYPMNILKFTKS